MSSFTVLKGVSESLREILWEAYRAESQINPTIIDNPMAIVFKNPTETARDSANKLSLWLYQITENEFVKNQPMIRTNGPEAARFPPLALNLYYLITPFASSGDSDLLLLGKTMQVLYDNAILLLRDLTSPAPEDHIAEELQIIFCRLSLEELTRIWEALREPYRLSVCYQVRVTHLDSLREIGQGRVIDRTAGFGNKPVEATE